MRVSTPRRRPVGLIAIVILLFLIVGPSTALAQGRIESATTGAERLASHPWHIRAAVSAALTFAVGWLLVSIAPETMRRQTNRALEMPGLALGCGLASLLGILVVTVVLAATVIGRIFISPLLVLYLLAVAIASVIGSLSVGRLVAPGWRLALVIAAISAGLVSALPLLGPLIGFVITYIGVGTLAIGLLGSGSPKTRGRSRKARSRRG